MENLADEFAEEEIELGINSKQRLEISPGSTKYWIPEIDQEKIPRVGMEFTTLEIGVQFYKDYGCACGFDIRRSTTRKFRDDVIRVQYILCNREGFKSTKSPSPIITNDEDDENTNTETRKRTSNRVGCNARCIFEYKNNNAYRIKYFEERHTHSLSSEPFRHFLKVNRNLDFGHQQFLLNCTRANIGTAKSLRLMKEMVGGYSNVGALQVDFKNFKRDLKAYIYGADAQLIIDKFLKKKEISQGMAFNYDVDENEQLTRLFWADQTSIMNYAVFGDVISFDATYNTNRYKMVFAPFTGVDNHRKCVTFAAGLILKEDVESYVWLFKNFLETMGKEPLYIVTDQDPAMKNAMQIVFKKAVHRLCMWHIMEKVNTKVGQALLKDDNFKQRLCDVVWDNYLEPADFEIKWNDVMSEFQLTSHPWFTTMYELRQNWIPAYFRDVPMGGLLRTTSRSESTNSWFGGFTNPQATLVEFVMHFESAMDSQRHASDKLNSECETFHPDCKTPLDIEKHAALVYTHTVFSDVIKEIEEACYKCSVVQIVDTTEGCSYTIKDRTTRLFVVKCCKDESVMKCSCKMFEQLGLLCRHMFVLLKDRQVIPSKYLVKRWMKVASLHPYSKNGNLYQFTGGDESSRTLNNLWSDFHSCIALAQGRVEKLLNLSRLVSDEKKRMTIEHESEGSILSKQAVIETYCGSTSQLEITVLPPKQAKNKGSGSRVKSRIQSQKEKAIKASTKMKRRCGSCGEIAPHNSRTCPKRTDTPQP